MYELKKECRLWVRTCFPAVLNMLLILLGCERYERERCKCVYVRDRDKCIWKRKMCVCVCVCVYIYIYIRDRYMRVWTFVRECVWERKKDILELVKNLIMCVREGERNSVWEEHVWFVGFYGISTFDINPFLCKLSVLFKTIQFSIKYRV